MRLYQPESGYRYNSDSLFLHDFINSFKPKGRVLDVGAGCGVLGLLVARDNPKVTMEAVEKQEVFLVYAQKNANENAIDYKLHHADFLDFTPENKYDFIISNPPFYPEGRRKSENEVLITARYSCALPLEDFFQKVSRLLNPHSHFIFCYDPIVFGDICVALEKVKMRIVDVQFVHPKNDKAASLVMIHTRNGSKSMMKVREPLIAFSGEEYSLKTKDIYEKAQTKSITCQL